MRRSLHVLVQGDVQGVGYRYFAQHEAERLGLAGWVRNLRDDSVEAWAEGEEDRLQEWCSRLQQGPPSARVKEILPVWGSPQGMTSFEIRATTVSQEPF